MTRIVIHSDDAGATQAVTERIMGTWAKGLIESFSVLANGDFIEGVTRALANEPEREARIAVHLNLCEGESLAFPDKGTLITNQDGYLTARFGGLLKLWLLSPQKRRALLGQIELEWRKQIERVIETCAPRKVSVVDGHMHVHMLPFLFPIAARLAAQYNIPEIRVTNEIFHLSKNLADSVNLAFAVNLAKHIVLRLCAQMDLKYLKKYDLCGPDVMIGILYTGRMTAASAKSGIIAAKEKKKKYVEVLFHVGRGEPGEVNRWNSCPDIGRFYLCEGRDKEYEQLKLFHTWQRQNSDEISSV